MPHHLTGLEDEVVLHSDYDHVRAATFKGLSPAEDERPLFLVTAGGPGAGKTTLVEQYRATGDDPRYAQTVFVDPDRQALPMMETYTRQLSADRVREYGYSQAAENAYTVARPGSNAITAICLNEAFNGGYHIAQCTTLTPPPPVVRSFLQTVNSAGYESRLLLCGAPDAVRQESVKIRTDEEGRYQATVDDFVQKADSFADRHGEYFANAEHIIVHWRPQARGDAIRAAEYKNGAHTIHDPIAFNAYIEDYQKRSDKLTQKDAAPLASWDHLERLYEKQARPQTAASTG